MNFSMSEHTKRALSARPLSSAFALARDTADALESTPVHSIAPPAAALSANPPGERSDEAIKRRVGAFV